MAAWLKEATVAKKIAKAERKAAREEAAQRDALGAAVAAAHANAKAAAAAEKQAAIKAGTYIPPPRLRLPQPKRDPGLPSNSFR